jgi:DNA-binding transcriptional regulator YiaG
MLDGIHVSVYDWRVANRRSVKWDARSVRGLRQHLDMTQAQLAEEIGVRQQTVSEWETGQYTPRGASEKLLNMVAEKGAFEYRARR